MTGRPLGPQDSGWYVNASTPRFAHFYLYLPRGARGPQAWVKPRCGHTGRWLSRVGIVPAAAHPHLPACQRCVRLLARDLGRSGGREPAERGQE